MFLQNNPDWSGVGSENETIKSIRRNMLVGYLGLETMEDEYGRFVHNGLFSTNETGQPLELRDTPGAPVEKYETVVQKAFMDVIEANRAATLEAARQEVARRNAQRNAQRGNRRRN
jgi:hypothetical protein